jgi:hypothetical protein
MLHTLFHVAYDFRRVSSGFFPLMFLFFFGIPLPDV